MSSQHPAGSDAALRDLLEPLVRAVGFDLEELDVRTVGRRSTVRLVVDSDDGAGLADIATLSRRAAAALDDHERIDELLPGAYTLEVTSPGVDRPLTAPRHWRRAHLRLVRMWVAQDDGPPVGLTGRVGQAGEACVEVLVDGRLRELPYTDIDRARVEVEFREPPAAEVALLAGKETR